MPQNYAPEFKKKIVRTRLEEGRTINNITTEYNISKDAPPLVQGNERRMPDKP